MATEFIMGARASCSDGPCGEVIRTIIDPVARTVTHLVIQPGRHAEDGRLVPVGLVEPGRRDQAALQPGRLRAARGRRGNRHRGGRGYAGGYGPDAVGGYGDVGSMGVGGSASGMGIGMGVGHGPPIVTSDNVPEGESEVIRHEPVHAVDGEVGQLKGFAVDSADHRVTHVLLREGHLWGRREVAIPVSAVVSMENGISLNLTKKQVEELPPRG